MSLHNSLTIFIAVLAVVALTAAGSLVLLPTYLHLEALDLGRSLQSVRLAEEMQVDLLNYLRTNDEPMRSSLEADLRQKLSQAGARVTSAEERAVLTEASSSIETHFENTHQGIADNNNLERAFFALREFVDINVRQADMSIQKSARLDRIGDWIGIGSAALLTLGVTAMLIWLGMFALRPVFAIRDAMKAFGSGAKSTRAPENGPEELRGIAAQFNDMAAALKRQHENQLSFLAAVAHDLRNPLNALRLSAEILKGHHTIPPSKLSDLMSVVMRQVHRLDRMVGDLLDRARIEGGKLELRLVECDARKIAQDAFDLFSSSSTAHRFALHLPESEVPIRCDPFRIEQVLNNLISNAIKYSPSGGTIELELQPNGDNILFKVSDQGMGIPKEDLPYIFEPFRRSRLSREDIPGVGLGLSVAQRIVQAHSGRIEADSRLGQGTIVRVYLPAQVSKHLPAA
jgi:signal transduction histidine kinase